MAIASPDSGQTGNTTSTNRINNDNISGGSSFSYFQKTVSLLDWWLIKAEKDFQGKRLAVAGFTSREKLAFRVFYSAPITKRYDVFTLETADGVAVIVQGFINKTRTIENGFPYEVFSHFLFGFPPYWEQFAEKFFGQTLTFDFMMSNSDPGTKDSSQVLTPITDIIGSDEHNDEVTKDCSQNVSEKVIFAASKRSDFHNDAAKFASVQEKPNTSAFSSVASDNREGMIELSQFQNEYHPSVSASPIDSDIDNAKTDASKNCLMSSGCHVTLVNSMEENIAVQAEPSSHHMVGSSGRIDDIESSKESKKKRSFEKSKNKVSASLEGMTFQNDASEECSVPKGFNTDNLSPSNFEQTVSIGTSGMALTVSANKLNSLNKKQKENQENKDGLKCRSTSFLTASLTQGPEAVLCIDESGIIREEYLPRSPTGREFKTLKQSANHHEDTVIFSTVHSGAEVNVVASCMVERDTMNVTPSNSRSTRIGNGLRNLKDNQKKKPVSGCSVKQKNKEITSEAIERLNGSKQKMCSHATFQSPAKVDTSEAMLNTVRKSRNFSWSLRSKGKDEHIAVEEGGLSQKKAKRKIIFNSNVSPCNRERKETTHILSPKSLSLKRSRSGRLLLPTLDFWRNQIPVYDADRNITGIQEELDAAPSRGSKSEPRNQRKRRQFA